MFDAAQREDLVRALGSRTRGGASGEVFQRVPGSQIRLVQLDLDLGEPLETGLPGPIRLVDLSESGDRRFACVLGGNASDGSAPSGPRLVLLRVERNENLLTGEVGWETQRTVLPYEEDAKRGFPAWLLLSGGGDSSTSPGPTDTSCATTCATSPRRRSRRRSSSRTAPASSRRSRS